MNHVSKIVLIFFLFIGIFALNTMERSNLKGNIELLPGIDAYRLIVKFKAVNLPDLTDSNELVFNRQPVRGALDGFIRDNGLIFERMVAFTDAELTALRARTTYTPVRAGEFNILDYAGLMIVEGDFFSHTDMLNIARALEAYSEVEYCELEPLDMQEPPYDISPTTPSLVDFQDYRGLNPGIDSDYAWSLGIKGAGINVADIEYDWDLQHEEFNEQDVALASGMTPLGQYKDHGTAVLGIIGADASGYGISGTNPDATFRLYAERTQENGSNRAYAIIRATADFNPGDVIILEMQMTGAGGGYGPAELSKSVWDATRAAVDKGIIVCAAAGNGNQNLDGSAYASYMNQGDSGAIIVGAGSSTTAHSKLSFSTYGSRVDVQGWGQNVFTTGYGAYKKYGNDNHQSYTDSFNGTSSATPVVTSAVIAIQCWYKKTYNAVLSPAEMRSLLKTTGIAQGSGGHIGPLPNVKEAIQKLMGGVTPTPTTTATPTMTPTPTATPTATPVYKNVAVNKKITASGEFSPEFPAVAANDGNDATVWGSLYNKGPQWFFIDLEQEVLIDSVVVKFFNPYYAPKYHIGVSHDALTWEFAATIENGDGGDDTVTVKSSTRYIGIYLTNGAQKVYGIKEFEAYTLVMPPSPTPTATVKPTATPTATITPTPTKPPVDDWKTGVDYSVGQKVYYNGKVWVCSTAHTSNAAWYPGAPGVYLWREDR